MSVERAKAALRTQVRASLRTMSDAQRREASTAVCRHLRERVLPTARTLLFYAPLPGEVDVWPVLAEALVSGLTVALPRFDAAIGRYEACVLGSAAGVVAGPFGIREPLARCPKLEPPCADWILVPGLAFDVQGGRLGRGKGYYDRLLLEIRGTRCGVAFEQQILPGLPCDPHDVRMDALVTPTRWIQPSG